MKKRTTKKTEKLVFKSAKTGRFINKGFYQGHPSTTVSERVPVRGPKARRNR